MTVAIRSVPQCQVQIAGQVWEPALGEALVALEVHEALDCPRQCEIEFLGPTTWDLPTSGELRIACDGDVLFAGEITAVTRSGPRARGGGLRLRAYDATWPMARRQAQRVWYDTDLTAIAEELAAGCGCTVAGPTLRVAAFAQTQESDLDALRRLCASHGLHWVVRDGSLQLLALDGVEVSLHCAVDQDCETIEVEDNRWQAYAGARVQAWDPASRQMINGEQAGGEGSIWGQVVGAINGDGAQASALAAAHARHRAAAASVLRATVVGDPAYRCGSRLALSGDPALAGRAFLLTAVSHRFSADGGYRCELSSAPPARPPLPPTPGASLAEVVAVDDPSGAARVRVRVPALGGIELHWLPVLIPAAGGGKGLLALPDVGDHVVLLHLGGDASQGVVLGGLFGDGEAPESGCGSGAVTAWSFVSKAGHSIVLDDANDAVSVTGKHGSSIELEPGGMRLHAACDLTIEAPGKSITITANSVDFKQG